MIQIGIKLLCHILHHKAHKSAEVIHTNHGRSSPIVLFFKTKHDDDLKSDLKHLMEGKRPTEGCHHQELSSPMEYNV